MACRQDHEDSAVSRVDDPTVERSGATPAKRVGLVTAEPGLTVYVVHAPACSDIL